MLRVDSGTLYLILQALSTTTLRHRRRDLECLIITVPTYNEVHGTVDWASFEYLDRVVALRVHDLPDFQLAFESQSIDDSQYSPLIKHLDKVANIDVQVHPGLADNLIQGDLNAFHGSIMQNHRPVFIARRQEKTDFLNAAISLHPQAEVYRQIIRPRVLSH